MGRPRLRFNYHASAEEMSEIQGLVQRRMKEGSAFLRNNRKYALKNAKKHNMPHSKEDIETNVIMAMYIHTAYEIGRMAGEGGLDNLVNRTLRSMHPEFDEDAIEEREDLISTMMDQCIDESFARKEK